MYSSYLRRMTKKYKIINEGKEGDEEGRSKKYKTIMKEKKVVKKRRREMRDSNEGKRVMKKRRR